MTILYITKIAETIAMLFPGVRVGSSRRSAPLSAELEYGRGCETCIVHLEGYISSVKSNTITIFRLRLCDLLRGADEAACLLHHVQSHRNLWGGNEPKREIGWTDVRGCWGGWEVGWIGCQ